MPTGFNSQPPEGGWPFLPTCHKRISCFNSQPPEGGWLSQFPDLQQQAEVSTHSRPKAAGLSVKAPRPVLVFQLTAARRRLVIVNRLL